MARLLPIRTDTQPQSDGPRVVDIDDEEADEVFSALSSDTARSIYRALHEEPRTPSDVAEAVDTSIQNVRYHLGNLEDAGLIEEVDTWYSSRGNEMSVYAPASDALVFASDEEEASRLRNALSRLVGGVTVLAMASLLVQRLARRFVDSETVSPTGAADAGGGAGADGGATTTAGETPVAQGAPASETPTTESGDVGIEQMTTTGARTDTEFAMATDGGNVSVRSANGTDTATETTTTVADTAVQNAPEAAAGLPPGMVFFAGGLVVLLAVVGYWYWLEGR